MTEAEAKEFGEVKAQNVELREEVARLWQQIRLLKKALYGRKSEKLSVLEGEQQLLFEQPEAPAEETPRTEVAAHQREIKRGRKPLPENLLRERIEYEPEEQSCACCGEPLAKIGEEISEELDFRPAQFVIIEHVRIKRACAKCKEGVYTGSVPPAVLPIEKGRPSVALLVYILISKFCDHLPLYRQEQIYARHGVPLRRQRMCDWLADVAELLRPIAEALKRYILDQRYVQADETTLKVQESETEGKLLTGYLWGMLANKAVYFHYAPSRASKVPLELFAGFTGYVQTDAYVGYEPLFLPETCQRLACMAHVRRKLIDAQAASNKEGNEILKLIAELYKVEERGKKLEPTQRRELRVRTAVQILDDVLRKLEALEQRLLPENPLRKACRYALNQREELKRYLDDGSFGIDNNPIERQMRPVALGRKNWLFAGSHEGAERAAIFFSLINSCKLAGVNPFDYLCDVMRRLPRHPKSRIDELLPHNWKPASLI